jgi:hypothetical protein
MIDFYEIKRVSAGRVQYGADGVVMGERSTFAEAVAEIEKLQGMERGEKNDKGTAKSL